jgi:3-oxoacyl-[acyl-carrier-protein] synthase-1
MTATDRPEQRGAWIHGIGMTTPVGLRADTTAAAVRAGVGRQRESDLSNCNGEPMVLAVLPDDVLPPLAPQLERRPALPDLHLRALRLATHALREATAALPSATAVPLLLAGPEPYPDLPPAYHRDLLAHLRVQTGVEFAERDSAVALLGRAGALALLAPALALLHTRGLAYVLLGGLDSHLDLPLLGALDHAGRVQATGVVDGFVPGEGAAFLLLSARRRLPATTGLAWLGPPGLGEEPGHRHSDQPHRGDGLADAVRAAVQRCPAAAVHRAYGSLNGERYGAREWGVAAIRSAAALHPELRLHHPADCLGDPGAAAGPILLGLAALDLLKDPTAGASLVWCASEGPLRAATVVRREPATDPPAA